MDNKFMIDINDITYEYEIVKICKNNDHNYLIYKDSNGLYASRYDVIDNKIQLDEIIDDSEWDYIDSELNKLDE